MDGELDESPDEMFNLQRALSLSSWPTTQALGPLGTFNSSKICTHVVYKYMSLPGQLMAHKITKAGILMLPDFQVDAYCVRGKHGATGVCSSAAVSFC